MRARRAEGSWLNSVQQCLALGDVQAELMLVMRQLGGCMMCLEEEWACGESEFATWAAHGHEGVILTRDEMEVEATCTDQYVDTSIALFQRQFAQCRSMAPSELAHIAMAPEAALSYIPVG